MLSVSESKYGLSIRTARITNASPLVHPILPPAPDGDGIDVPHHPMDPPLTTRWTLLTPSDGLNEPSSVIHRLIFGDGGGDTAAVLQVGYETIVATVAELSVEVVDFAHQLRRYGAKYSYVCRDRRIFDISVTDIIIANGK